MDSYGVCHPEVGVTDFAAIAELIRSQAIDLLVVGPEVPLVRGIVDYLRLKEGLTELLIVGPDQVGAQIEGSKEFSKAFMERHAIPTARYRTFDRSGYYQAVEYLQQLQPPYVLKADGLAAGKGVVICETLRLVASARPVHGLSSRSTSLVSNAPSSSPRMGTTTVSCP